MRITPRTAVYLLKRDNKPFYIGKTTNPIKRWQDHSITYNNSIVMEIIDEYDDVEIKWVEKFKEEGIILENKNTNRNFNNNWKIGDIYSH
jgi:predicted GIY-YIG superfamily endonuclease